MPSCGGSSPNRCTCSGFRPDGDDARLWELLHHLFVAVKLHDMASDEDRKKVQQVIKLTKQMFFSKFSLKERKRQTKKQKGLPLAHPTKEKETNKEKAEKISLSGGLDFSALDDDQIAFWNECAMYIDNPYDKEMVEDFFRCFGEKSNPSGKMLWQTKRTWNTAFRLVAWSKRSFNANDAAASIRLKKAKQQQTQQSDLRKQQAEAAARRAAADARREAEYAEAKAGSVSLEEYLATHPGSTLKMLKK